MKVFSLLKMSSSQNSQFILTDIAQFKRWFKSTFTATIIAEGASSDAALSKDLRSLLGKKDRRYVLPAIVKWLQEHGALAAVNLNQAMTVARLIHLASSVKVAAQVDVSARKKSLGLLKGAAIKEAARLSPELATKLSAIYSAPTVRTSNLSETLKVDNPWRSDEWNKFELALVALFAFITPPETDLDQFAQKVSHYLSLSAETEQFISSKKAQDTEIVRPDNYAFFSDFLKNLTASMKGDLNTIGLPYVEAMRFLSESNLKVWLKDEAPLTPLGKVGLAMNYFILLIWAAVIIYPIVILIMGTFNANSTETLSLDNFQGSTSNFTALKDTETAPVSRWFLNTFLVSSLTTVITVVFTSLTGFAYSRYRFTGKRSIMIAVLILQMFPTIVAIPVFLIYTSIIKTNMNLPLWLVLVLIYSGGAVFGNTFVFKGYMDGISREIDDASRIDGCTPMQTYVSIILPLSKPVLVTVALWSFIGPIGDFILPSALGANIPKDFTLAAGLRTFLTNPQNIQIGKFAAGSLLSAIPVVVLFFWCQRYIRSGATSGGVK